MSRERARSSGARGLEHLEQGLRLLDALRESDEVAGQAARHVARASKHLHEAQQHLERSIRLLRDEGDE